MLYIPAIEYANFLLNLCGFVFLFYNSLASLSAQLRNPVSGGYLTGYIIFWTDSTVVKPLRNLLQPITVYAALVN